MELEAQCQEASQEKQKNAQLSVRVQELEAELNDKEQVRHLQWQHFSCKRQGPVLKAGFYLLQTVNTTLSLCGLRLVGHSVQFICALKEKHTSLASTPPLHHPKLRFYFLLLMPVCLLAVH